MKPVVLLFCCTLMIAIASAQETNYTASTPAGTEVRLFLGISLNDSVDFIRWKISINKNHYRLHCNYGIGQPNTNGFIHGGKTVQFDGNISGQAPFFQLQHAQKTLAVMQLNDNLLHFSDAKKHLLVGNGGWSYTLNNTAPMPASELNWKPPVKTLTDSLDLEGRSPCGVPGIKAPGELCYKLKWHIVFYADGSSGITGTYTIPTVPFHKDGGRKGKWKIVEGADGRRIYELYNAKAQPFLYLVQADENILLFTDAKGNLLVGDEDFSYTLNRRQRDRSKE